MEQLRTVSLLLVVVLTFHEVPAFSIASDLIQIPGQIAEGFVSIFKPKPKDPSEPKLQQNFQTHATLSQQENNGGSSGNGQWTEPISQGGKFNSHSQTQGQYPPPNGNYRQPDFNIDRGQNNANNYKGNIGQNNADYNQNVGQQGSSYLGPQGSFIPLYPNNQALPSSHLPQGQYQSSQNQNYQQPGYYPNGNYPYNGQIRPNNGGQMNTNSYQGDIAQNNMDKYENVGKIGNRYGPQGTFLNTQSTGNNGVQSQQGQKTAQINQDSFKNVTEIGDRYGPSGNFLNTQSNTGNGEPVKQSLGHVTFSNKNGSEYFEGPSQSG